MEGNQRRRHAFVFSYAGELSLNFNQIIQKPAAVLVFVFLAFGLGISAHAQQTDPLLQTYLYDVANPINISDISGISGAFSHSIPIAIPPGRKGMQPGLSFVYSNQGGQDLNTIGYGWDIPIPYIERINKVGTGDLYTEDYFSSSLSGELATTTSPGVFYPRADDGSYLQYVFASSTNQWTVTDKSGTVYKFGHASTTRQDNPGDSTEVYKWMLEETRDTNGNFVSYEYFKDSGFIYPSQVTYTGNGVSEGIFTIDFTRESRPDIATSTAPGFEVEAKYRIDQVLVSVDGTWVRKYDLIYTTGDNNRRSLLDTITESGQAFDTGSSVVSSLPATNFDYQTITAGWATTTSAFSLPYGFRETYEDTGVRIADINGDALPDFIRAKEATTTQIYLNDGDSWNLDTNWVFPELFADEDGIDLGTRLVDLNGDGLVDIVRAGRSGVNRAHLNTGSGWATTTDFSAPYNFSTDYGGDTGVRLADINGDGLVDLLYAVWFPQSNNGNESVRLNTGSGWEVDNSWDLPIVFQNQWTTGNQTLQVDVEDVNNDGLADLVTKDDNQLNDIEGVLLNTGSGWTLESSWNIPGGLASGGDDTGQRLVDVNGDHLVDYIDGSSGGQDVYINNRNNWALDTSWVLPLVLESANGYASQVVDIDGDGMVDIVQRNENVHNRYLNRGNPVDILVHIDESSGSDIDVTYQSSANSTENPDLPFTLQTATAIGRSDGLGTTATTTYQYEDGEFYFGSRLDRMYAGFGLVSQTDPVGNVSKTFYHQGNDTATSTGEYNDRRSKIGKSFRTETYDDNENLYSLQIQGFDHFIRGTNADFVFVATTTTLGYDGDADHRDMAESFSFSTTTGSVLQKIAWGEVNAATTGSFSDTGSDKRTTAYSYAASSTSPLLVPSQETVTNQGGSKIRETRNYYDTLSLGSVTKGNLSKQELWESGTDYVDVEKTYNSYGLVTQDKDPRDKITTYTYDAYNLYAATTTNPLSQVTGRTYDYSSGKVNRLTDANSRVFQTLFDPFDRPIEEKQPDLSTPSSLVTRATYSYTDTGMPRRVLKTEYLGSATSTVAYTYADGNGKTVEERVEAEGSNTYTVRDFDYDLRGLLASESLPFFASSTAYTATSSPAASNLLTEYEYDPLERVTSITTVLGETTNAYDQWNTRTTDALDNYKDYEKDAYGNLIEVVEHNDASSYTTAYEYNGNDKLTKITDAEDNIRNFTYDGLGRRLTAQDLHDSGDGTYGTWTYDYDAAGNLTSQVDPKSQTVNFTYDDLNRVLTENYTGAGGTEVQYAYDSCTEGVGRLCTATSTDAITAYTYNALGSVASETKTIDSTDYTTSYSYDRKGNIIGITYPNNSQVSYAYNHAGYLESLAHKEGAGSFANIVSDFDYAPTGKVSYKAFANGVTSTYTYDPTKLYRLTHILTVASSTEEGGGGGGGFGFLGSSNYALAPQGTYAQLELTLDLAEEVVPEVPVIEEPVVEEVVEEEVATPNDVSSTTPVVIESPPVEETASSTPEASGGTQESVAATTTPAVVADVPLLPIEPAATTTPEVVIPEEQKFLLTAIPGMKIAENGNIKTEEVGIDEKGDTIYEAKIYQLDVQYLDPLTGERKDIDTALQEDGTAWSMTTAPYGAWLSKEVTDKTVAFRSGNLELYFAPVVIPEKAARGQKSPRGGESVRYPGALGEGIDLEVRLGSDALFKEAVLDTPATLASLKQADGFVEVPFALQANEKFDLVSSSGESLDASGTLTTDEMVTVVSESDAPAYFRAPVAYDANGNVTPIEIRYERTETGVRLTKLLPLSWLEGATYPVRTDTVVTYYSGAADGHVYKENVSNWNTIHDATSGTKVGGETMRVQTAKNGSGNYFINRVAIPFNTSGLPDNAVISSATLRFYVTGVGNTDNDGNDFVRVVQTTTNSATDLVDEDYDQIGAIDNPTAGATDKDISTISNEANLSFSLNATGMSWIDKSGWTKLGLREGHDAVDAAPDYENGVTVYTSSYTDPARQPRLEITYTTPTPPSAPTNLFTEGQTNPTDITDYAPEFSAIYQDSDDGDLALYYQLQVATSTSYWGAPIWDSAKTALNASVTEGNRSEDIPYIGTALSPSTTYYWRIKFWDQSDAAGDWSTDTASFSIASSGASLTPIYKSVSNGSWVAGTSIAINKPSGLEEGDLMVALIASEGSASAPSGWTAIDSALDQGYDVSLSVFGRIAESADVATSTYTFSGGSTVAVNASILRIANADLSSVDSSIVFKSDWGSNPTSFSPGLTPSQPESLMVMAFHAITRAESYSGYTLASSSPSWTERFDTTYSGGGSSHMFAAATGSRATSTPTGAFSVSTAVPGTGEKGHGLLLAIYGNAEPSAPTSLQTEDQTNPVNVTDETPEFSAIYQDLDDGDITAYYQLQVATSTDFTNPFWDSSKTAITATTSEGSRIPDITYGGSALTRETTYYWRIKLWDDNNTEGAWSSTANFFYAISGTSDVIQDISYTYDAVGNITKITDVSGTQAAKVVLFGYDDLYRLTTASTTAASSTPFSHTYTYNSIGNISSSTPSGAYVYGETGYTNPQAPTQVGGVNLTYDNNGNLTAYGTDLYTWNYKNHLLSVGDGSATTSYAYDHTEQRVSKTTGGIDTIYPNQYFTKENATTTKYIWAGDTIIATVEGNGSATSTEYVHQDHLGSTNVTTNNLGAGTSVLDYLPYGAERVSTGDDLPNRGYISQFTDREADLSYLNNRYLSSERGQFISQDPVFWEIMQTADGKSVLVSPQAQNSYSYAGNNPITSKDPTGRAFLIDDAAGFLAGGLIGVVTRGAVNLATGQKTTWGQVAGSFVTGGIIGVGAVNTPETLGASNAVSAALVTGLIGGFYGNVTEQGVDIATGNQEGNIDLVEAQTSGLITAGTNAVLQGTIPNTKVPKLSGGRGNMNAVGKSMLTKGARGSVKNISLGTGIKSAIGSQANDSLRTGVGTIVDTLVSPVTNKKRK